MRARSAVWIVLFLALATILARAQGGSVGAPQGSTAQPSAPAPRQGGAGTGGAQAPQGGNAQGGGGQNRGGGRARQGADGVGPFGGLGRLGRGALNREPVLGTAVISGRVVAADTGAALRRAQIRAQNGQAPRLTTTDDSGRFELRNLPAGRWTLTAVKAGYVSLRLGQRRPAEAVQPIDVAEGARFDAANFALPRGAVVSGRVTDDAGDPIAGVRVQALSYRMARGQRQLSPVGVVAQTDDTGSFRIYGLGPGDYYVSARADAGAVESPDGTSSYAPTYFPGTSSITEAQRVSLAVGEEQPGVSFPLLLVRTVKVSGVIVDSAGAPVTNGIVALTTAFESSDAAFPLASNGRVRGEGQFVLTNVVPGSYTLQVMLPGAFRAALNTANPNSGPTAEMAYLPLVVGNEDLDGVTVTTTRGATVNGTLVAEQGTGQFQMTGITVMAQPLRQQIGAAQRGARAAADGTFSLAGVVGPQVLRVEGVPQGWMVSRVEMNGADVTDVPLEFKGTERVVARVVLTNRVPELGGTVRAAQESATGYQVVVFPADPSKWTFSSRYLKTTRAATDGSFTIRALPPNDRYLAVALDYLDEGEAMDPEFLDRIKASATSFSLREGEMKTLDLKLVER
jgi:hypothetical protein